MRSWGIHARETGFFARLRVSEILVAGLAGLTLIVGAVVAAWADAPPFVPPAGWQSVKPEGGLLGVWVHPGDEGFHQNMVVGRERTSLTASAFDSTTIKQLRGALHDFQLGADEFTTTCGGRPAHYISYASTVDGNRVIYEHLSTVANGYAWFVIYARQADQPSLPEARRALTTLCGIDARPAVAAPAPVQTGNRVPTPEPTPTPTYKPIDLTNPTFYTPTPIPKPSY
jgi:hypothetical protein